MICGSRGSKSRLAKAAGAEPCVKWEMKSTPLWREAHFEVKIYKLHYTTLQLRLQLRLRYTTLHPAVAVRWPLQTLQPLQKTQLQTPFGPSAHSRCHQWVTRIIFYFFIIIYKINLNKSYYIVQQSNMGFCCLPLQSSPSWDWRRKTCRRQRLLTSHEATDCCL